MFVNPDMLVAIVCGALLFLLGQRLAVRVQGRAKRGVLGTTLLILCLPGASFIAYYLHIFGEPKWYINLRCVDHIELLTACWGLWLGFLKVDWQFYLFRHWRTTPLLRYCISLILIALPFCKPLLLPVEINGRLREAWQDGVCLQSSPSTCGPASLATIMATQGVQRSEREIAKSVYSCMGGTELWYLIRYARHSGLHAQYLHEAQLAHIPTPAILGTRTSGYGHFIALLASRDGQYVIGDPMIGRLTLNESEFHERYHFDGCVLKVSK